MARYQLCIIIIILRVCQNCYFQIRLIRRLWKTLSVESKLLLVHALFRSRLG